MNKLLLGSMVVVVGGVIGWYYLKGTASKPATVTPPVTEVTPSEAPVQTGSAAVSFTDTGFSPATITVKKGTSVTFTNTSAGSMWVASDVHPTHLLLPGFDERKSVSKDGTYTYTFAKVGTWTYHNHLTPTEKGTVIVTE